MTGAEPKPELLGHDHGERQRGQRGRAEHRAGDVNPVRIRVGVLRQDREPPDQGQRADDQVEPEDRAPGPDSPISAPPITGPMASATPDTAVQTPSGPGPLPLVGVDVPDHRQGARLAGRRAEAHDGAAGDQHADVRRLRGHDRPGAEDHDPDDHDALAAELVADHAEPEHRAGEGQRVRAHHPLQRRDPRVQVALHIPQRDADDRVVEERQEQDNAEHREGEGATATPGGRRLALGDAGGADHRLRGRLACGGQAGRLARVLQGQQTAEARHAHLPGAVFGDTPFPSGSSAQACRSRGCRSSPSPESANLR